jgi:hypothetical protein
VNSKFFQDAPGYALGLYHQADEEVTGGEKWMVIRLLLEERKLDDRPGPRCQAGRADYVAC